jgi:acetyl esterase/lipase
MNTRRHLITTALALPFAGLFRTVAGQDITPPVITVPRERYALRESGPLLLDVLLPPAIDSPRGAVLLFHGGAWTYGLSGPQDMIEPAAALAAAGYAAFVVRYRLTGTPGHHHQWPDQLDDAQEAVRWVRANAGRYGFDPDRIAAYGHSAGGHLAAHLAARDTRADDTPELAEISSRVQAAISIASHYDLSIPYPLPFDQERINALLGGAPHEVPEVTIDASPITWVTESCAPFLLIAGGADEMSPIVQTRSMAAELQNAGVDITMWEDATGDHFNVAQWAQAGPWTLAFLDTTFNT